MMQPRLLALLAPVLAAVAACGGGGDGASSSAQTQANTPPSPTIKTLSSVFAGTPVTLDGTASTDRDGDPLTFSWAVQSRPTGSSASPAASGSGLATFTPDVPGTYTLALTVSDGRGASSTGTLTIQVQAKSANLDRTRTQWLISESTSSLDGTKTTRIVAPSLGGANFVIYCDDKGRRDYRIETDFITGSGTIQYRVGHYPVATQVWRESQALGFKVLTPLSFDVNLLKSFYNSNEFILDVDKFGQGLVRSQPRMVGFAAAVDKTRAVCKWSLDDFPEKNGWTSAYPDDPPASAKPSIRLPGGATTAGPAVYGEFGFKAWVANNPQGKPRLLVRIADDKSLCTGSVYIDEDAFYVHQNGKRVEAVPGFELQHSCQTNAGFTMVLQGDFDPSLPFVLRAYPFHYTTLEPGSPFAEIAF